MKDEKSRDFMNQYMVPNSREFGINGIYQAVMKGLYTVNDFNMIMKIFGQRASMERDRICVKLSKGQSVEFVKEEAFQIELYTDSKTGKFIEIENVKISC